MKAHNRRRGYSFRAVLLAIVIAGVVVGIFFAVNRYINAPEKPDIAPGTIDVDETAVISPEAGTVTLLVGIGDKVEPNTTVVEINGLKLRADYRGRVGEILVEDGQKVEFGERLLVIDPDSPSAP